MKYTHPENEFISATLDEAYENNDIDFQLFYATTLIEEAFLDIRWGHDMIKAGHSELGLAVLRRTERVLAQFYWDGKIDFLAH